MIDILLKYAYVHPLIWIFNDLDAQSDFDQIFVKKKPIK